MSLVKPAVPIINNHPTNRGFVVGYFLDLQYGHVTYDDNYGMPSISHIGALTKPLPNYGNLTDDVPTVIDSPYGHAYNFEDVRATIAAPPNDLTPAYSRTTEVLVRYNEDPGAVSWLYANSPAHFASWAVYFESASWPSDLTIAANFMDGGGTWGGGAFSLTDAVPDGWNHVFFTYDHVNDAVWVRCNGGGRQTESSVGLTPPLEQLDGEDVLIGAYTGMPDMDIASLRIWDRALEDDEIDLLFSDPWIGLRPRKRFFLTAGEVSGDTILNFERGVMRGVGRGVGVGVG
jgi:hypothetical protein